MQDGVRPLGSQELIRRTVAAAAEHGAAIPVVEPVDSFRETDGAASQIIDRRRLRIVQTPQVFRAELLRRAYESEYRPEFTDDASVVELSGEAVFSGEGERAKTSNSQPPGISSSPKRCWLTAKKRTRRKRMEKIYKYRFEPPHDLLDADLHHRLRPAGRPAVPPLRRGLPLGVVHLVHRGAGGPDVAVDSPQDRRVGRDDRSALSAGHHRNKARTKSPRCAAWTPSG